MPRGGDAVNQGEDDNYDKINEEINNSGESGRDDDDIFRKANLADELATSDDGLDALIGAFGEERPKGGAGKKINRIVGNVAAEAQ